MLVVIQSLVLVYAHLIHTRLEAVIGFLGGVPGPSGQSALAFVLMQWCSKQHLFYGNYERKASLFLYYCLFYLYLLLVKYGS